MAFQTDYSDVNEGGGLIPKGEYECIIKYGGEDSTKGGTTYMSVVMVLRNDVDQQYKNKYLFHKIWHKKDPSPADLACGGYSSKQINSLSKAAKLPNGKEYESLANWADDLQNRCVRVTVEHDEYNGETREKVKWTNETKFPECSHRWKNADDSAEEEAPDSAASDPTGIRYTSGNTGDFEEIPTDDDLPF